jgi:RNA polymerase sigma factor (sigma-70 family)
LLHQDLHNEHELLQLILKGDEFAFAKLFEFYKDSVYGIAFKVTRSTIIAQEIVQNVFLKIWQRRESLHEIQNFSAYLFAITRNDVYKALKVIAKNIK